MSGSDMFHHAYDFRIRRNNMDNMYHYFLAFFFVIKINNGAHNENHFDKKGRFCSGTFFLRDLRLIRLLWSKAEKF